MLPAGATVCRAEFLSAEGVHLGRAHTTPWLDRVASELNRGDGRDIDRRAREANKCARASAKLKLTINLIYTWGIEERFITDVNESPVYGLEISPIAKRRNRRSNRRRDPWKLLRRAKEQNHPWYPVWVGAILNWAAEAASFTSSVRAILNSFREISLSKKTTVRSIKGGRGSSECAGAGTPDLRSRDRPRPTYRRTLPVSSEFYWFLMNGIRVETMKPDDFIFPKILGVGQRVSGQHS